MSSHPNERLTRGELVVEILDKLEKNLRYAKRINAEKVISELESAIRVLKIIYSPEELTDFSTL